MIDVMWFEAVGLFLVLVSSFIKLFLSDPLSDIHRGVLQMRQEEKIDHLWMLLTTLTRHVYPASSKVWSQWYDLDGTDKSWKHAKPSSEAGKQADIFKSADTYMFLIGSLLLVGAKACPLIWPKTFHEHSAPAQQITAKVNLMEKRLPLFEPGSATEPRDALTSGVCDIRSALGASGFFVGIVVGHHDRRPLSKVAAVKFSSNSGLAQQRADTVSALLRDSSLCSVKAPPLKQVLAITGGPRLTDALRASTNGQSLKEDRSVEVIGMQSTAHSSDLQ